jgi:hypothetical protein
MHQNDHFIVMPSQTLLHVTAYQRHHQGVHMILTSSGLLWNTAVFHNSPLLPAAVNHIHCYLQCKDTNRSYFTRYSIIPHVMHTDIQVACEDHMSSLMMALVRRNM